MKKPKKNLGRNGLMRDARKPRHLGWRTKGPVGAVKRRMMGQR